MTRVSLLFAVLSHVAVVFDTQTSSHFSLLTATEVLYVTGDFESLTSMIQIPLIHARCFEDKLNSYDVLIRYLMASGQMAQGT